MSRELTLEEKYNEFCNHVSEIENLVDMTLKNVSPQGVRELASEAWDYELSYLRTLKGRVYHCD